jgi:hypothetical protein
MANSFDIEASRERMRRADHAIEAQERVMALGLATDLAREARNLATLKDIRETLGKTHKLLIERELGVRGQISNVVAHVEQSTIPFEPDRPD